jgi:hypothetical protein
MRAHPEQYEQKQATREQLRAVDLKPTSNLVDGLIKGEPKRRERNRASPQPILNGIR